MSILHVIYSLYPAIEKEVTLKRIHCCMFSVMVLLTVCQVRSGIIKASETLEQDSLKNIRHLIDNNSMLLQKIDNIEYRFEIEMKYIQQRFEDYNKMVFIVGGILAIIISLLTIVTYLRNLQQHKDYIEERKFYQASQTRTEPLFDKQLDSIEKLGGVLDLVKKVFETQDNASKLNVTLSNTVEELSKDRDRRLEHQHHQFETLYSEMGSFIVLSRMEWPTISTEETNHLVSCQSKYQSIDPIYLTTADQSKSIKMLCAFGIGAFYNNNITSALDFLENTSKAYEELNMEKDKQDVIVPYAFCSHYRGLIEKNWTRTNDVDSSVCLERSRKHLEMASDILSKRAGTKEFLSPITLFEVLTYFQNERLNSLENLKKIILAIEQIKIEGKLTPNLQSLLCRAYVLSGNCYFLNTEFSYACECYLKAISTDNQNIYALFSLGITFKRLEDRDNSRKFFNQGLDCYKGQYPKPEITTQGTRLGWAYVAAWYTDISEKERIKADFFKHMERKHAVGNLLPLFFSPVRMMPVTKEVLLEDIENEIKKV